jgi:hypothetical protein
MKFRKTSLAVAISLSLTACGGGGGGGGGGLFSTLSGGSSRNVPFHAPIRVDAIVPINSNSFEFNSSALIAQDLDGDGAQSLILAGRMAPSNNPYADYNMQIWDWQNGSLVNRTADWFQGTDNRITGTEPSVKFADFDGDGRTDMYVSPYTDTAVFGPGLVFFNEGNQFTRQEIDLDNTHGHGSAVYDLNGDGFMDIVTTGLRFTFGGPNRTFTTHWGRGDYPGGGGDVAVADFLGDGSATLILTDMGANQADNNRLYSWRQEPDGVYITQLGVMPTPRFLLPKWQAHGFTGSHDIRVLAFDFDNSGRTDAVIFSRPWITNGVWPEFSEIQFNRNLGGGQFEDVTDSVLIGYDNTMPAPYHPALADVNNDGLIDIVLGGTGWDSNRGAQVLMHTQEHKYVASYSDILKVFADQALDLERTLNSNAMFGANGIAFVKGPDNVMYLATAVSYDAGGQHRKAIYLSRLGDLTPSAQITAAVVQQAWPWMSPAQVNAVLAASSAQWLNGVPVVDYARAMNPIGGLGIKMPGADRHTIEGHIRVPGLDASRLKGVIALDDLQRNFTVDLGVLVPKAEPMNIGFSEIKSAGQPWSSRFVDDRLDLRNGFDARGDSLQWTTGFTMPVQGEHHVTAITAGITHTVNNPWLDFSGVFGRVRGATSFDTTLSRAWQTGHWAQLGVMQTKTDMDSGLVRSVDPLWSAYAVAGYRKDRSNFYGGIQPTLFHGEIHLSLPTHVDNQGVLHYTEQSVSVRNRPVAFVGADHTLTIKHGHLRMSTVINQTGAYRVGLNIERKF